MELFLIKLVALLRPILSIINETQYFGISLSEVAGIALSALIVAAFAIRAATQKKVMWSSTDLSIATFSLWCAAVYFIYYEKAHVNELAKLVLPMLTYIVAKNVILSKREYLNTIWLMLLGFTIPSVFSSLSMLGGGGYEKVNYWTGVWRYEGLYAGSHSMGHNSALLLLTLWLYVLLSRNSEKEPITYGYARKLFFTVLIVSAIYCLYQSQVRTAIVGLSVFATVVFIGHYKKPLLILVAVVILVVSLLMSENLQDKFFPEGAMAEKTHTQNTDDLASGRPRIWKMHINAFFELPIDRQIAGFGIGNNFSNEEVTGQLWLLEKDAHNDYLRVMYHTGIVGLFLFLVVQITILRKIYRLNNNSRYFFLALFSAASIMNFLSNSYVMRFELAQIYYLLLAYLELPDKKSDEIHLITRRQLTDNLPNSRNLSDMKSRRSAAGNNDRRLQL